MTARILLALIAGYRRWFSPALLPACRFHPSCSEYAAQAIALHGSGPGAWLAAKRLLRCHPFSAGGFDPAPYPTSNLSAAVATPARDGRKH